MNNVLNQVKQQIESWPEWPKLNRIVLAVSGGVDSMTLLHVMNEINQLKQYQHKQFVVAHFNHKLRPESDDEALLVQRTAEELGMMYFVEEWKEPSTVNMESHAREARYQFYADVIEASESQSLMTGHHLNDVAETMMMRLIRGTSIKGMQSIQDNYQRLLISSNHKAVIVYLMRPLIQLTKKELYQYAQEHRVAYREDVTNEKDTHLRNRVRHTVIPFMEKENPQFLRNIYGLSEQFNASYLAHYQRYLKKEPYLLMYLNINRWLLYTPSFNELPSEERLMYLSIFFEERLIDSLPTYNKDLIGQLDYMITKQTAPNMELDLGQGWRAVKRYDIITIQHEDENEVVNDIYTKDQPLEMDEVNKWYQLNRQERVGIFRTIHIPLSVIKQAETAIPLRFQSRDELPYLIRHRQDGDTIQLTQADGTTYHKKISRILIDDKVPINERELLWLLTDKESAILAFLPNYIARHESIVNQTEATHVFLYQKIEH